MGKKKEYRVKSPTRQRLSANADPPRFGAETREMEPLLELAGCHHVRISTAQHLKEIPQTSAATPFETVLVGAAAACLF